jgi:hypothetical protein
MPLGVEGKLTDYEDPKDSITFLYYEDLEESYDKIKL